MTITKSLFRKVLKKATAPQTGWTDIFPAVIGLSSGTIQTGTDGIIYVRNFLNGQVLTVYNFTVPNIAGLQVEVGRKVETPGLWQVKGVREVYAMPAGGSVGSASHSHKDLFIGRDRFLPFLVMPIDGGAFNVQVYGDVITKSDGTIGYILNQTLDLASHVPASGALYVVIEADDDGVLYVTEGTPVASKELLTLADIPSVTTDRVASCAVRLYDGQVQLYRDSTSINDFVDLRILTSGGGGGGGGAVDSVNGQTGVVVLDYTNVGADASGAAATAQSNAETYADGKVEDAITNGVITKAPSENAVYDALALKEDTSNKATTMTGNTGSNTLFLTAKAVYDWAIGLFSQIGHTHSSPVSDTAYGAGWNGDTTNAPSKNAVYDALALKEDTSNKATTMTGNTGSNTLFLTAKAVYDWAIGLFSQIGHTHSSPVSDTAYGSGWNGDTTNAPSKNAVYDKMETVNTSISDHIADTSDAHDASAISIVDSGNFITGTDVEAAIQELGAKKSRQVFGGHGNGGAVPAGLTYYIVPMIAGLDTVGRSYPISISGTIKNLYFRLATTQPASGSLVITIYEAGTPVSTGITITIPAGSATGTFSNTTHTYTHTAGNLIHVRIQNNATGTSGTVGGVSFELESALA